MISTNEEFEIVHGHLCRMEAALALLRQEVFPKNKRNYHLYGEGYMDQIVKLRAEIDAYLRIGLEPMDAETAVLNGDMPNHRSEMVPDVDAVQSRQ